MSREILNFFAQYIEKETGIFYQDGNLYQLQTRMDEIVKQEKFAGLDELYKCFKNTPPPSLRQKLLDHATNNETLFFRDPSFFISLSDYIEQIIAPRNPGEIKIWSAASSTGQEAVSVAIVLEELSRKISLPPYTILATDISERALSKARAGIYTDFEVHRGLSPVRRDLYFTNQDNSWKLKSHILSKISYRYNNLTRPTVRGPFHVILCRNVLIYQKVECKRNIVLGLLDQLDPEGALMLGVGETLLGVMDEISPTMIGNVPFYKNKNLKNKVA
jgi:chemotaxis protein methyltransferase CheR